MATVHQGVHAAATQSHTALNAHLQPLRAFQILRYRKRHVFLCAHLAVEGRTPHCQSNLIGFGSYSPLSCCRRRQLAMDAFLAKFDRLSTSDVSKLVKGASGSTTAPTLKPSRPSDGPLAALLRTSSRPNVPAAASSARRPGGGCGAGGAAGGPHCADDTPLQPADVTDTAFALDEYGGVKCATLPSCVSSGEPALRFRMHGGLFRYLFEYQRDAVAWLWGLYGRAVAEGSHGGILGDGVFPPQTAWFRSWLFVAVTAVCGCVGVGVWVRVCVWVRVYVCVAMLADQTWGSERPSRRRRFLRAALVAVVAPRRWWWHPSQCCPCGNAPSTSGWSVPGCCAQWAPRGA